MQVLFIFQNFRPDGFYFGDAEAELVDVDYGVSKYDLTLELRADGAGLTGHVDDQPACGCPRTGACSQGAGSLR